MNAKKIVRLFVLFLSLFIPVTQMNSSDSRAKKKGQVISAQTFMDIDDVRYNLVFSDLSRDEITLKLKERREVHYRLATPSEEKEFFQRLKRLPGSMPGMRPYIIRPVLPPKSHLTFSSPSKYINGTLYMFAYSKLDMEPLMEALKNQLPMPWRLADESESSRFLETLNGQKSFIETNQPALIENMKMYVVARIPPKPADLASTQ